MLSLSKIPDFRPLLTAILLFSGLSHILGLSSPLFLMHVYDRVLYTRSGSTLVFLAIIFSLLLLVVGVLDFIRSRIATRLANLVELTLLPNLSLQLFHDRKRVQATPEVMESLQGLRAMLTGPAGMALLDVPWVPVYIVLAFILHPVLGLVSVASTAAIAAMVFMAYRVGRSREAFLLAARTDELGALKAYAENSALVSALGASDYLANRWISRRCDELKALTESIDFSNLFLTMSRTFRVLVQLMIVAVAAWLAIQREVTGGAIFAASIIVGRALAPVEVLAGSWNVIMRGASALRRLMEPAAQLDAGQSPVRSVDRVREVALDSVYAGRRGDTLPGIGGISLRMKAGEFIALVGPIGAGKSLLCRVLVGAEPLAAGSVRINGMELKAFGADMLRANLGYLPQVPQFLPGSVEENIARFLPQFDASAVIEAAREMGVHHVIERLPNGYRTPIEQAARLLSMGEQQLVCAARAIIGHPSLTVLDAPDALLDPDALATLENLLQDIRKRGDLAVVASHHPRLIRHADRVVVLAEGKIMRIATRDEFFRSLAEGKHAAMSQLRQAAEGE